MMTYTFFSESTYRSIRVAMPHKKNSRLSFKELVERNVWTIFGRILVYKGFSSPTPSMSDKLM